MSPQEMNIKIAESLGWLKCERLGREVYYDPTGGHVLPHELPNYYADLNACHEMEEKLTEKEEAGYFLELQKIIVPPYLKHFAPCIRATAPQRCEAYLRVKGLWPTRQSGENNKDL